METVTNIRTVVSFASEDKIMNLFGKFLEAPQKNSVTKGISAGCAFGFSNASMLLVYGILFYLGALFHQYYELSFNDMLTAFFAIVFAAFAGGNANFFMPDVNLALKGADKLFKILDA